MKRSLLGILAIVIVISIILSFSFGGCTASVEETESTEAKETSEETGGTLTILTFMGYAEDAWVKPFEEKYGCDVQVTYAGTQEEHNSKTKATPEQYNLVCCYSGGIQWYYDNGLLQSIDISKLENYNKIGAYFRENGYAELEQGKIFQVPITWGDQDFVVNTSILGDKLDPYLVDIGDGKQALSYEAIKAPEFKDQVTIMDEFPNVCNMSAINAGIEDPFQLDEEGYTKMAEELTKWAENCRAFTTGFDSEKSMLTSEDTLICLSGNNAIVAGALVEEGLADNFTHYLPAEGTICWIDGWVITKPTEGRSYDLALKYIDYMISDEVQTQLAELIGFGIVNDAGSGGYGASIDRTWWYGTSIQNFPVPLYVMVTEEDPERRNETWNEIKASLGY